MKVAVGHIIPLKVEADIANLTQSVRAVCLDHLFDRVDTEQMVLACSEIGHNAIRHGLGGQAEIQILKAGKVIRVIVIDHGPGIANLALARREGYTTVPTSLGLGLEGAERLVDRFAIESTAGRGTKVTMDKFRPLSREMVDYGLVSIPDNRYNYNGDQYIRKEYDGDALLVGVIDGPGQGYDAYAIARSCKQFVENNYQKSLAELMSALNTLMQESRDDVGITCALAKITPQNLEYLGLGDTHAYVSQDNGPLLHLQNQAGRVGYVRHVKSKIEHFKFENRLSLILCTDGIKTIYADCIESENAQHTANTLFDNYHRNSGDATILITHYKMIS